MMPAIPLPFLYSPAGGSPEPPAALSLAFDRGRHYTKELPAEHRCLQRLIT